MLHTLHSYIYEDYKNYNVMLKYLFQDLLEQQDSLDSQADLVLQDFQVQQVPKDLQDNQDSLDQLGMVRLEPLVS